MFYNNWLEANVISRYVLIDNAISGTVEGSPQAVIVKMSVVTACNSIAFKKLCDRSYFTALENRRIMKETEYFFSLTLFDSFLERSLEAHHLALEHLLVTCRLVRRIEKPSSRAAQRGILIKNTIIMQKKQVF